MTVSTPTSIKVADGIATLGFYVGVRDWNSSPHGGHCKPNKLFPFQAALGLGVYYGNGSEPGHFPSVLVRIS